MLGKIKYIKVVSPLVIAFVVLFAFYPTSSLKAVSSLQMNFSGKIVTSDGFDLSYASPDCILEGADTCHFQIKYYDDVGVGDLLGSEVFEDIELGDYRGYFNLKFGAGAYTAGEYSSMKEIFLNEEDVYIEVLFDPTGGETPDFNFETNEDLERFLVSHDPINRMPVGSSPYSISTRGAIDDFQLKVKESSAGDSKGLMYFDGGENFAKIYDGTEWRSLSYLLWEEDVGDNIFFTGGSVGIGKDTLGSTYVFDVLGDSLFTGDVNVDSGDLSVDGELYITQELVAGVSEGAVHIDSDGKLIYDASSIRYKDDINTYGSVLSKLTNLNLVRFSWNELTKSSGKEDVGMIAEDVLNYIPELVLYNSFGQVQGLRYDRMGAFAIAGLTELKEEFDVLKDSFEEESIENIYTSEFELEIGNLVSRDFSSENGLLIFENTFSPLYGVVSDVLLDDEEELYYEVKKYEGFGESEILIHRFIDSKEFYESGTPVYLVSTGEVYIFDQENLDEDDEFGGLVLGYLLKDMSFEEEDFSMLNSVYLTYAPLNFGFNSTSFSSLFSMNSTGDITFGGGHVNFRGGVGEFLRLRTDLLNISDRIMIYVDEVEEQDIPKIEIIDGENTYNLLEEVEKLREELEDLKNSD